MWTESWPRRAGVVASGLLWGALLGGCDGGGSQPRPPRVGPASMASAAAPRSTAGSTTMAATAPTAASSAGADPLFSLGVAKAVPDGFVLFDDGLIKDSQAPILAVIVPAAHAARFHSPFTSAKVSYWTPLPGHVMLLNKARDEAERRQPAISRHIIEYRYQVVGIVTDQRRVFVNAFCRPPASWTTEPVVVDDGGACYFQLEYDPESGALLTLAVNGEA